MKVKLPYNINLLTSRTGLQALKKKDKVRKTIRAIIKERKWLVKELSKLSCIKQVFPSDANFILVRCEDADELYQSLVKKDIIIRNRSTEPRLNNCLRITVGTRKENVALLSAMKDFCL
jgi:histidinol-phosphate aminotransferase